IENSTTTFTDMGVGIAYLPALYLNEEIVPYGVPFILQENCNQEILKADKENSTDINLNKTTEKKLLVSTDGISKTHLDSEKIYEFYYWDDGWQLVSEKSADDKSLIFENIPVNGLYWFIEKDSKKEERIFTYENGQQIWW
ncbi:MAG: hypothetical protein U9N54_06920, partial [candidate division Zixibacteria bacterium]|nr:hypothetical protein [candidate division Zixibacteria bacterium]